jgi:hypothetical protein
MRKQASKEQDQKSKKLQLHKETLQRLVYGGDAGGTVTLYTCPDNTTGYQAYCAA